MDAVMLQCAALIDDLDEIFTSCTTAQLIGRPVISVIKNAGLVDKGHLAIKNKLLTHMRDRFIVKESCSLRVSDLLLFCNGTGFELVTYYIRIEERASFYLRSQSFDLVVEYTR